MLKDEQLAEQSSMDWQQLKETLDRKEYDALVDGAALQARPEHGLVSLTDSDRVDFIHRMTTNDVAGLEPGRSTVTVMLSSIARILFVFTVVPKGEALWLLPAGTDANALAKHLGGQIFFMDKVAVENKRDQVRRMRLMGPAARTILEEADLPTPDADHYVEQNGVVVLNQPRFDIPGYELVVPEAAAEATRKAMTGAGAILLHDALAYKTRRVELGRPGSDYELVEDFTPLETGMAWTCAEDSGCYTGQEIIARQISYDKVTKSLVGLRSEGLLPEGARITADGRPAGTVTSSVYSPTLDGPLSLAVVKRPHDKSGSVVTVDDGEAEVVDIPFDKGQAYV